MNSRAFYRVALVVFALDQASKIVAHRGLSGGPEIPLISGYLALAYAENCGAAFGTFQNAAPILVFVSMAALGFIVALERRGRMGRLESLALALLLGGAAGNLTDRLRLGFVVDFISLQWKGRHVWPIFNVADTALTVGATILLARLLLGTSRRSATEPADGGESGDD